MWQRWWNTARISSGGGLWSGTVLVFLFKQKTAYEVRISDWSSDVCSSDLSWPANPVAAIGGITQRRAGEDPQRRKTRLLPDRRQQPGESRRCDGKVGRAVGHANASVTAGNSRCGEFCQARLNRALWNFWLARVREG